MNLSGPEKAAFLLLSLDEDQAAPVLSRLKDDELQLLFNTAQRLGKSRVGVGLLDSIYKELAQMLRGELPILHGGGDYVSQLLRRAVGEDRAQQLLRPPPPVSGPLDDVASDGRTLAQMLTHEHPQTVAAVLSQVEPAVAAVMLNTLSEDMQEQVIDRMSALAGISPTAIHATRDTLSSELGDSMSHLETTSGTTRAAAILNELLPEQSTLILAKIESRDPERAANIRREQFTFDDLARLDRRGMQILMREIDANQLVVALKTASDDMKARVFSSISSRASETLKEDLANLGPQRLADVEKAQREIVLTAIRLQSEGKLVLITSGPVV